MYAIRCKGQMRGYRVGETHYPSQQWTLQQTVTPEHVELTEPPFSMLEIVETNDALTDARLAPFPVATDVGERPTVVHSDILKVHLAERDTQIAALSRQVESLSGQLAAMQAERRVPRPAADLDAPRAEE